MTGAAAQTAYAVASAHRERGCLGSEQAKPRLRLAEQQHGPGQGGVEDPCALRHT